MNVQKLIKAYIIDDNQEAIDVLRLLLETHYSVEVVGTKTCATQAIDEVVDREPDLLFLDVELPDMSGLEFCTLIRQRVKPATKVVFYTGHDKYMLDAIRREAFDYLLKPPSEQELSQIMTRYYENRLADLPRLTLRDGCRLPLIMVVNYKNEHMTLHADDCVYFRYNNGQKQWEVVCCDGKGYTLRHRTTADTILNYTDDYAQIHKSYIVNINHIRLIQDGICILDEPLGHVRELRISKNYRPALMDKFYAL